MKILPDYPSASAVEYLDDKLYVMGDDATKLLVLDTNFNAVDSIQLFDYPGIRIPKNIKHDIESILFIKDSNQLMLFGSGSLSPFRDTVLSINLNNRGKKIKSFTDFYSSLKKRSLDELNIEGTVKAKDEVILVNRGHLGWPKNHLILTDLRFWTEHGATAIIPVKYPYDSSAFHGISGLTYSKLHDALVMSVSTEATASTFEDGAIGKSYIWIIKNIPSAIYTELSPDIVIDLEEIDPIFKGQKIESVTILNETKGMLRLVLVADNDNGSSTIFKLSIKLN
jgi:hypothetical protein